MSVLAFQVGVGGLKRQLDAVNGAAAEVLVQSSEPSTPDRVNVSEAARQAAATGTSSTAGLEGALVNLRVSKYLAVANLRVLKTSDDMTHELTELVK